MQEEVMMRKTLQVFSLFAAAEHSLQQQAGRDWVHPRTKAK